MAVGFRGASGVSPPTLATNCTVSNPGVAENDYMVVAHASDPNGTLASMTAPAGWDLLYSTSVAFGLHLKVWGRKATASESSSWTFPDSNGSDAKAGLVAVYGQDQVTPIYAGPTATIGNSAVAQHTAPSVSGIAGGLLLTIHSGGSGASGFRSYGPPSGMDERVDQGGTNAFVGLSMNTLSLSTNDSTGNRTATMNNTTRFAAVSIVFAPAPEVSAPVADAGADASVEVGSPFVRTGTGTNSPTSYSWSLLSAPDGVSTGVVDSDADLLYTPTASGTYVFELTASNAGGSGTDTVTLTVTAVHVRTGGAAAGVTGSGPRTVSSATVHSRTGGAVAGATGSGSRAVSSAATYDRSGGSAASATGSGAASIASAVVYDKAGGAVVAVAGSGLGTASAASGHDKAGGAAAGVAGSGAVSVSSPTPIDTAGGAVASATGSGAVSVSSRAPIDTAGGAAAGVTGSATLSVITVVSKTGGGAAGVTGSGTAGVVNTSITVSKTGGAVAGVAGSGAGTSVPAKTYVKAGGGGPRGTGSGPDSVLRRAPITKSGGAAAGVAGVVFREVISATVFPKSGGAVFSLAGSGAVVHFSEMPTILVVSGIPVVEVGPVGDTPGVGETVSAGPVSSSRRLVAAAVSSHD